MNNLAQYLLFTCKLIQLSFTDIRKKLLLIVPNKMTDHPRFELTGPTVIQCPMYDIKNGKIVKLVADLRVYQYGPITFIQDSEGSRFYRVSCSCNDATIMGLSLQHIGIYGYGHIREKHPDYLV